MHNVFRLTVSAIALTLATSTAFADPDGFVAGSIGANTFDYNGSDNQGSTLADVRASATGYLTPTLSAQGDVVLQYQRIADEFNVANLYNLNGALHLNYREAEQFLVGGFAQVSGQVESYDSGYVSSLSRFFAGLEGQLYLDDLTLYGQVGATRFSYLSDYSYSGLFATVELRYFLTPDLKVDAHGIVVKMNHDQYDFPTNTYGIGIGAEYRLPDSPLSLYGALDHFSNDFGNENTYSDTRVTVGIKFNFGSDTLKDQDRNGTTLKPVTDMPFYGNQT